MDESTKVSNIQHLESKYTMLTMHELDQTVFKWQHTVELQSGVMEIYVRYLYSPFFSQNAAADSGSGKSRVRLILDNGSALKQ